MAKSKHIYQNRIFKLLPGNAILYHPGLKSVLESVGAVTWMCQALYWCDKANEPCKFTKSRSEFERETGLTRDQQIRIEQHLKNLGLISVEVKPGRPSPINHITVNISKLEKLLLNVRGIRTLDERVTSNIPTSKSVSPVRQTTRNTENISEITQENTKENAREPPGEGYRKFQEAKLRLATKLANK